MNNMENIEKQLADFKAEQDKRFEEFKSSLVKPQFEVGKWHIANCNSNKDYLIRLSKICKDGGFTANCFFTAGGSFAEYSGKFDSITRPATPSEVESALVKEAKKIGFKEGVKFKSPNGKDYGYSLCNGGCFNYDKDNDTLVWTPSGCKGSIEGLHIYKRSKWATIIKDEVIKIGGYEVEFTGGGATTIDGNYFTKKFWLSAKEISEHAKAKIMIGCSEQFDVSLETINAILEKLK